MIGNLRLGILGGGQLARMLAESAHAIGLQPVVYARDKDDPAAQISATPHFGMPDDPVAMAEFFSHVDLVIFESEFISKAVLEEALLKCARPVSERPIFSPTLGAMVQLQNKIRQKEFLTELNIPSAPWQRLDPADASFQQRASIERQLEAAWLAWDGQIVLKWAEFGYDGKGTWISKDRSTTPAQEAVEFVQAAFLKGLPVFAEKKISFVRELAVLGCRSVLGEFRAYPLVVSEQQNGICHRVLGPATSLGVDRDREIDAHRWAHQIAERLAYTGIFALELFETGDGQLFVNELAPRVHNSGHYTQDAGGTSQFENHWRAVLGWPLGDPTPSSPAYGMINLLGTTDVPLLPSHGHLHLYGKKDSRPGRKMGHINLAVESVSQLRANLSEIERPHP